MESAQQLSDRFREVILNGVFIANTNFKHQLHDLTWLQANVKIGNLNTIGALTFHINYYIEGINHFFETGNLDIHDTLSFNMATITNQQEWETRLNTLWENAEIFATTTASFSIEQLDAIFVNKKYGNYRRNIEAVIEHSYYHLGQITLLKKLILNS